jgi:hypothetical protein
MQPMDIDAARIGDVALELAHSQIMSPSCKHRQSSNQTPIENRRAERRQHVLCVRVAGARR